MSARQAALAIALLAVVPALAAGTGWTHFVSKQYRYSAWYPPGWQPLTPKSQSLTIINFPQSERVGGGVIPAHGALIQAGPAHRPGKTIEELLQEGMTVAGARYPILDQTLLTGLPYADAPKALRQVEYYENYGSATRPILQHVTTFWCKVHGRIFSVALFYFRGNKDAKMLEAEALSVARSMRIGK